MSLRILSEAVLLLCAHQVFFIFLSLSLSLPFIFLLFLHLFFLSHICVFFIYTYLYLSLFLHLSSSLCLSFFIEAPELPTFKTILMLSLQTVSGGRLRSNDMSTEVLHFVLTISNPGSSTAQANSNGTKKTGKAKAMGDLP